MRLWIPKIIRYAIRKRYFYKKFGANIYSTDIDKNAILGKSTRINQGVKIGDNVSIGNYSYVNYNSIIAQTRIGKYCSIGPNVVIGIGGHDYRQFSTHPFLYSHYWQDKMGVKLGKPTEYKEEQITVIGNDVWIGANVVIMQGIKIGDGVVIGAGAVVTKNIGPYSIVGGIPAKKIKDRFSHQVKSRLYEMDWWNLDPVTFNEKLDELIKIVEE